MYMYMYMYFKNNTFFFTTACIYFIIDTLNVIHVHVSYCIVAYFIAIQCGKTCTMYVYMYMCIYRIINNKSYRPTIIHVHVHVHVTIKQKPKTGTFN